MNQTVKSVFDIIRAIRRASSIKTKRNFDSFFADRIYQAATEPTILSMVERLIKNVDTQVGYLGQESVTAFLVSSTADDAQSVLAWVRKYSRIAAMIASIREFDDYEKALEQVQLAPCIPDDDSIIAHPPNYDITITATLLSPLAHGGDMKLGNTTLFRRRQIITQTGRIMDLPFYSGNAIRGQMRDLLANHFLESLGLIPRNSKPVLNLWFFHSLYAGGLLEEQTKIMEAITRELGNNGNLRTKGMRRFRDMLPMLSLLGTALGNRVLSGRICVGDLRPRCREWGTGNIPSFQLFDWEFLTRREDCENRGDDEHAGMITNTEVIKSGMQMVGGIDILQHAQEIELSVLGKGIQLMKDRGMLGAENRRGFGKVKIDVESCPSPEKYESWISDNKTDILDYLNSIGALCTQ